MTDHKSAEILLYGANDLIYKLGSEESSDHVKRLLVVSGKSQSETHGNELSSMFEHFLGENSSLVQVAQLKFKMSCLEWLQFLLFCNSQKTNGSSCTEFYSNEHKVENKNILKQKNTWMFGNLYQMT